MPTKLRRKTAPFIQMVKDYKLLFLAIAIIVLVIFFVPKILPFLDKAATIPRFITSLLFNKKIELKREDTKEDGAINILLLGIAGGGHEGARLTDTIMFAHVDPKANKVVLVSIPRDLWAPPLDSKINAAYEFGEEKRKGGGLTLVKATVSDLLGQPIHYAFRIDFSGFVQIIDQVGGLTIDVNRTFDDYNYPIAEKENDTCGKTEEEMKILEATISASPTIIPLKETFPCRVEHLHFDKGRTHMDGTTALKFVRSRQALGEEGTDFARSRRQQKVLVALRDKVLSLGILLNPFKLIQLSKTLGRSIDTDIIPDEYDDFVKLAQKMQGAKVKTVVLDQGDEQKDRPGLLVNPPISEYGAWVLAPRTGNFKEIQDYVACQLKTDSCPIPETP